jgi:hypothetical protein
LGIYDTFFFFLL